MRERRDARHDLGITIALLSVEVLKKIRFSIVVMITVLLLMIVMSTPAPATVLMRQTTIRTMLPMIHTCVLVWMLLFLLLLLMVKQVGLGWPLQKRRTTPRQSRLRSFAAFRVRPIRTRLPNCLQQLFAAMRVFSL